MGLRRYTAFRLAWRAETDLRERLVAHLQRLHFAFHDEAQTGQLMAHANTDVYQINQMLNLGPISLSSVFILVGVIIVMAAKNVVLMVLALGALPLLNVLATRFVAAHGPGGVRAAAQARRPVGRRRGDRRRHPRGEGLRRRAAAAGAPSHRGRRSATTASMAAARLRAGFLPCSTSCRRCRW